MKLSRWCRALAICGCIIVAGCGGGGSGDGGGDGGPDFVLTKSASPTTLLAPGGNVQFTIDVVNDDDLPLTIDALTDTDFDLSANGRCPAGPAGEVIAPGDTFTCVFTEALTGAAGTSHSNTVTATLSADGETETETDSASVSFTAATANITVVKTANPTSILAPGGNINFTVVVTNNGATQVTLTALTDSDFGDLNPRCPGVVGTVIAPAGNATCNFTAAVNGAAGTQHVNTATATAQAPGGNTDSDNDDATVDIVAVVLTPAFTAGNPSPGASTISLQPGTNAGATFQVRVRATDFTNFFGTAVRINYPAASADFTSSSSAGSVLTAPNRFDVLEIGPGIIDVVATREGATTAGINVSGTQTLITLTFTALAQTAGAPITITTPRQVQTCPTAGQPCTAVPDGSVTWSGGTLVVN